MDIDITRRKTTTVFQSLGEQLLAARKKRDLSQPTLAEQLGRNRARISELERDLANNRLGRDRLTLFAELCDTLVLVSVLIPKSRMESVRLPVDDIPAPRHSIEAPRAFDELFIDLDDDETKEGQWRKDRTMMEVAQVVVAMRSDARPSSCVVKAAA
ncbi:transcriptional regulator with XRE-family HTH domain [Rhizobium sp. SLBN-94]|nr:transcriptional regulator with XRE-family HTH domain [Rhizobium sp. SLBN-94]